MAVTQARLHFAALLVYSQPMHTYALVGFPDGILLLYHV